MDEVDRKLLALLQQAGDHVQHRSLARSDQILNHGQSRIRAVARKTCRAADPQNAGWLVWLLICLCHIDLLMGNVDRLGYSVKSIIKMN